MSSEVFRETGGAEGRRGSRRGRGERALFQERTLLRGLRENLLSSARVHLSGEAAA